MSNFLYLCHTGDLLQTDIVSSDFLSFHNLIFIGSSVSRFHPRGALSRCTNVSAGGMLSRHRFPPHVSLHLTVIHVPCG